MKKLITQKLEENKIKAKEEKKKKNDQAWLELLTSINLQETNKGTLLDKLQEYNFPTKIK